MAEFDLHQQISSSLRKVAKEMSDIGGATSPEMKVAGQTLARSIRKTLSVRAVLYQGPLKAGAKPKGIPSPPGEPPRRITSRLYKSVGTEVVGGVLRVGEGWFTGRLLEGGVDATLPLPSGKKRRRATGLGRRRIKIAPRPFMQRSLEAALPKMDGDFAVTLRKRVEGGGSIRVG